MLSLILKQKELAKVVFSVLFLIVCLLALHTFWTLSHTLTPDFSVYYQAAQNILHNGSVYHGKNTFTIFAYPVVSALIYIPFTLFPYFVAQEIFLCLNFLSLLGISYLLPLLIVKKRNLLVNGVIFSLVYLSFPTKFTLGMGQINLIAYFFLTLSIYFVSRSHLDRCVKVRPLLAALFFALACVTKPILGFILVYFLLQKQWKVISLTLCIGILSIFVSILIDKQAWNDYIFYIPHIIPQVANHSGQAIYYNQGIMSFVFRTISLNELKLPISYLLMGSVFLLGLSKTWKNRLFPLYQLSILLSMIPLLDTLSWQHHFVILIFPFTYATWAFIHHKKWLQLVITLFAYILVSVNFARPEAFIWFPGSLLLSNTFYGGLLLFVLLITNAKTLQKSIA